MTELLFTETLPNGNTITYRCVEGTYYHAETTDQVIQVLERARAQDTRIRVYYGDTVTGKDWDPLCCANQCGYLGRSTGRIKIPLLVHNSRSHGGGALLDDCIVRIETTKGKRTLYQHPKYHIGE